MRSSEDISSEKPDVDLSVFGVNHAPPLQRAVTMIVVVMPFVALIGLIVWTWGNGFNWLHLGLFIGMYLATGLGITIGFHRFFTHRSFNTSRAMQAVLAVLGSMAFEGPLLRWVATHRCHHQHSDDDHDPHSPHSHGGGLINMTRGLWRAHIGWMFEPDKEDLARYVVDFRKDRLIRSISSLFPLWAFLGLAIPGVIAGVVAQSWTAALLGVLWGGVVRIFFVHHVTWSINSVCHIWGSQPFRSHDHSRNNLIFGVLAFGEGWHNNHHAFPSSARHGLRWWEFDSSYIIIWLMSKLGLVRDVRVPSADRIQRQRDA